MNDITFKVAAKGEGKTKWLLSKAHEFGSTNPVVIVTKDEKEFAKFCEKYFATYNKICPVYRYTEEDVGNNTVVLIDDVFTQNISSETIREIRNICYKMFVTVEGVI